MANLKKLIERAYWTNKQALQLNDFSDQSIPETLGELKYLREIHISGCPQLHSLPASLGDLPNLKKLTIVNSALENLPDSICNLSSLSYLKIHGSQIRNLPKSIAKLVSLQQLIVTSGHLSTLPEEIGLLPSLVELIIHGNRIRSFPNSFVQLKHLRTLYASGNWLQLLPDSLSGLQSLVNLILAGNYLSTLPSSIGNLRSLKVLKVPHNRLHTLPASLRELRALRTLDIVGNQALGLPVELIGSEPERIIDFFFRAARRRQLNEAKILLVGQGGVGKTSLVNRLLDGTFDENEAKTEGIRIRDWSVGVAKKVRLNVWDFGGQEIMHATHQFFLTKRSLYILVLDARAGEREGNIHYWLEMISIYGAKSPLIVVLNKSEQHYEHVDENRLRLDYENSVNFFGFHTISCKTGMGINTLLRDIEKAIKEMPHVSDYLPEDYFAVKANLEAQAENTDFITEEQYVQNCMIHGVTEHDEQRRLLRFLHDLGCVLHYDDPEQRYHVHDTRVLNPTWVTGGVYRILNDAELLRQGSGIVTHADLKRLLEPARYPEHRYRFLIDIMRKYDLCIEFPDNSVKVLVPELLSKNEPDVGWASKGYRDVLEFQYHYAVLPRGLIPRFIVRTQHLLTKQPTVWRAGVVLSTEGCRVLVRGDLRKAKVYIQVQGAKDSRRRALAVVRNAFQAVHPSYGDLTAEAKVPLPLDLDAPPVDYRHLLKLERQSVGLYLFEKAQRAYNVKELLDGIDERRFDVFLSHNSSDKPAVRELAKLLQNKGVRYWLDEEQLQPGQHWQKEMASALRDCYSILVLVGFKGVGPWEEEESAVGLNYAARGNKIVIPVLLPHAPDISELPPQFDFLTSRTWMDFRDGYSEEKIQRLAQTILRR